VINVKVFVVIRICMMIINVITVGIKNRMVPKMVMLYKREAAVRAEAQSI